MSLRVKFGLVVKALRKEQKLSQEELAEKAGLHRTYIGMIERGEKNVTLENIHKISQALNVSLPVLFGRMPE
ncbi:helix-turn-helix domain-containing protein [Rudanella lutea]|uniref:helix-turn-helix domain-containing protein n=1 Tax=Rudanella lutea TaxID=451374 RepID=UPI00036EBFF2|nr:helix-turn-helix transcriptional regulator [Rudanella lutea]